MRDVLFLTIKACKEFSQLKERWKRAQVIYAEQK
jgi:hypothetical protein